MTNFPLLPTDTVYPHVFPMKSLRSRTAPGQLADFLKEEIRAVHFVRSVVQILFTTESTEYTE
jgi:hypothetical protein